MDRQLLQATLARALPLELRGAAPGLAELVSSAVARGSRSGVADLPLNSDPALPLALHELAGSTVAVLGPQPAQLVFGDGQYGDISVGDIVSGDKLVIHITVGQHYPRPRVAPEDALDPDTCPYPGARPFNEGQRRRFFGRRATIERMLPILAAGRLLTIIGPSGSGKTSLVAAGLIPALRGSAQFGPGEWQILPVIGLGEALPAALDLPEGAAERQLILIDAFEAAFARPEPAILAALERRLAALIDRPAAYLVLTMRAEYYHRLITGLPNLWPQINASLFPLASLDAGGLAEAIVGPAAQAGLIVETALVGALVSEALGDRRDAAVLPFLQATLVQIWEKRTDNSLTLASYQGLGGLGEGEGRPRSGLQRAMALGADAALQALSRRGGPAEQEGRGRLIRRIFLRLLQFDTQGAAVLRRQQSLDDLAAEGDNAMLVSEILDELSDARLISMSGAGDTRVDLAHEALIVGWPQIGTWLDTWRRHELVRRRLEERARAWVAATRPAVEIDPAERGQYMAWLREGADRELGIRREEREFLRAAGRSAMHRKRERLLLGGLAAALLIIISGWAAYPRWLRAQARALDEPRTVAGAEFTLGPDGRPDQDPFFTRSAAVAAFRMDTYEVSNSQYCHCRNANGCHNDPAYQALRVCDPSIAELPVTSVTLQQASDFCAWLGGAVPTEAQWEWAARGPDGDRYPGIPAESGRIPDARQANILHAGAVREVRSLGDRSHAGIVGMTGNVREWTTGWALPYQAAGYGASWPDGVPETDLVVVRGGSANADLEDSAANFRLPWNPGEPDPSFGFRCVYPLL